MTQNPARWHRSKLFGLGGILALSCCLGVTGTMCPFGGVTGEDPVNNPPGSGNSGLTGRYVGAERCSQCHARIHEMWNETLHSKALVTLEAIGQGSNPDCIGCHTVGFGEEGGFVSRALTNALAGVQCESCHGPGGEHAMNVSDESLRPPKNISATVCGKCHTGSHHPNFEQWQMSKHALVQESVAQSFANGTSLNNCGTCHSGDFRYMSIFEGVPLQDNYLMGKTREEMNGITCVICHMPHQKTGNAPFADAGRDYQLRFPEVRYPVASNTIEDATNPERFNICGQCHRSRGRVWTSTSRGPHHSIQANVYAGEMPVPADTQPLVLSVGSPHSLVREQCATCHMYRQDFMSEVAPAISGHNFTVSFEGCVDSGCHPSAANAESLKTVLENFVMAKLNSIKSRLDTWATSPTGGNFPQADDWDYSCCGGTSSQSMVPDTIKKVRFLYYYSLNDGSYGIHNPTYVKNMIAEAEALLSGIGF